jgi:hypothetical protein
MFWATYTCQKRFEWREIFVFKTYGNMNDTFNKGTWAKETIVQQVKLPLHKRKTIKKQQQQLPK